MVGFFCIPGVELEKKLWYKNSKYILEFRMKNAQQLRGRRVNVKHVVLLTVPQPLWEAMDLSCNERQADWQLCYYPTNHGRILTVSSVVSGA